MTIEARIDALIAALDANTAALNAGRDQTAPPKAAPTKAAPPKPAPAKAPLPATAPAGLTLDAARDLLKNASREHIAAGLKHFSPDNKMSTVPVAKLQLLVDYVRSMETQATEGGDEDPLLA